MWPPLLGYSVINSGTKGLLIDMVLKPLLTEALLIGNLLKLLIRRSQMPLPADLHSLDLHRCMNFPQSGCCMAMPVRCKLAAG